MAHDSREPMTVLGVDLADSTHGATCCSWDHDRDGNCPRHPEGYRWRQDIIDSGRYAVGESSDPEAT